MVAAIRGEQESDRAAMNRVGELFGVGTGETVRKLVSAAKSFTPSKYAVGGEDFKNAVEMTVTLKNGTSENYDPGQFFATMQNGDEESDSIYDANVGSSPSTSLLPGRSVKFNIALGGQGSEGPGHAGATRVRLRLRDLHQLTVCWHSG